MPPCSVSVFANKGTNAAPQPRCCFPTGLLSPCPAPHQQGHGEVRVGPSPGRDPRPCSRGQMPVVGAGGVQLLTPTPSLQQGSSAQGALLLPHPSRCRLGCPSFAATSSPLGGLRAEGAAPTSAEACGRTPSTAHTPPQLRCQTQQQKKKIKKIKRTDAARCRQDAPPAPCSHSCPHGPCTSAGDTKGGFRRPWGAQPRGADVPLSLQVRTADMGGYATSLDFTQAVIAALDV